MKTNINTGNKKITSDRLFRNLIEQTPFAIQIHSLDGMLIDSNPAFAKLFGLDDEAITMLYEKYNILEDDESLGLGLRPNVEKVFAGDSVSFPEVEYDTSGTIHSLEMKEVKPAKCWIKSHGFPLRDEEGKITHIALLSEDVTARRLAEKELHDSRMNTSKLIQSANVMIVGLDAEGKINIFNPVAERISGYSFEEIKDKSWFSTMVSKDKYPNVHKEFQRLLKEGTPGSFENPITTKNGEERIISWSTNVLIRNNQAAGLISFGLDISDRVKAEEALLESEDKFRLLVEQSPLPIMIYNMDGYLDQANLSWQKMWGLSDAELMEVMEHYNIITDKVSEELGHTAHILEVFKGKTVKFPVVEFDGKEAMNHVGKDVDVDNKWIQLSYFPVKNKKGEVVNAVGFVDDYTERKLWEHEILSYQKRLQDLALELTYAEEKQRKQIATDLHDDVGQMLASSRMQIAAINPSMDKEAIMEKVMEVSKGLKKAIESTQQAIFDLSPPQLNEIGLEAALSDWMEEEMENKHGIRTLVVSDRIKYDISPEVRFLLFRCVRELLINVVKHADAKQVALGIAEKDGKMIISVQDDGNGFVYEPYAYEMKELGFGLFSIRERIQNIGGSLDIDSTPGKGTVIKLYLPIKE